MTWNLSEQEFYLSWVCQYQSSSSIYQQKHNSEKVKMRRWIALLTLRPFARNFSLKQPITKVYRSVVISLQSLNIKIPFNLEKIISRIQLEFWNSKIITPTSNSNRKDHHKVSLTSNSGSLSRNKRTVTRINSTSILRKKNNPIQAAQRDENSNP